MTESQPPKSPEKGDKPASPPEIRISKEDINELPLARYDGEIVVVNRDPELPAAVEALRADDLLGFDTETRPTFRKGVNYPVALLQLATAERVYLFQLLQLTDVSELWAVLADKNICKAGVAIRDDIRKLHKRHELKPGNFVEVSEITARTGIINTGLRALAGHYLGVRVSKSAQITNWSRTELTPAQIQYAATDAWVSRCLYEELLRLGLG